MKLNLAGIVAAIALAAVSLTGTASAAQKTANPVHLDVQTSFTSQSGNLKNYQGIFNVEGTFSKDLNKKLSAFATIGEDRVVNSQGVTKVGNQLVGLPTVQYGQFVFNVGGTLHLSPVTFVQASYGQRPSDLFLNSAQSRGIREVNLTVGTRVF